MPPSQGSNHEDKTVPLFDEAGPFCLHSIYILIKVS